MDIAKLLGAAAEVVSGVGGALGLGASTREPSQVFTDALAHALGTDETAETPITAEPGNPAPTVDGLPSARTAPLSREPAPTLEAEPVDVTATVANASAQALDLALATVLVTWADRSLGARGRGTFTMEGRAVDSLVAELPVSVRQAIEQTLTALQENGIAIPDGMMASLNAILGAVSIDARAVLGGADGLPQATDLARDVTETVLRALAEPKTDGQSVLETAARIAQSEAEAGSASRLTLDQSAGLLVRIRQNWEAAAPESESVRAAVGELLTQLRGRVVHVLSEAATTGSTTAPPTPAAASTPAEAAPAQATALLLDAVRQSVAVETVAGAEPTAAVDAVRTAPMEATVPKQPVPAVAAALRAVSASVNEQVTGRAAPLRLVDRDVGGANGVSATAEPAVQAAGVRSAVPQPAIAAPSVGPLVVGGPVPTPTPAPTPAPTEATVVASVAAEPSAPATATAAVTTQAMTARPVAEPSRGSRRYAAVGAPVTTEGAGAAPQRPTSILETAPVETIGTAPAYGDGVAATVPGLAVQAVETAADAESLARIAMGSVAGELAGQGGRAARPVRAFGRTSAPASEGLAGSPASASATTTPAPDPSTTGGTTGGTPGRSVPIDALQRLFQSPEAEGSAKRTKESVASVEAGQAPGAASMRSTTTAPLSVAVNATDTGQHVRDVQRESGALRVGVWNQLERAVNETVRSGKNAVVIELKPPHLGDVRVTISATEQAVVAHFEAQSHTVRATLESNMYLLKDMLGQAGLSPDRLEVTVGFGGAGDQGAWKQQGQRDPGAFYRTFDPRHANGAEPLTTLRPTAAFASNPYRTAAAVDLLA